MSFKPMGQRESTNNTGSEYVQKNFPEPKPGMRRARVSTIIDLGVQDREPGDDGKEKTPKQHVAIFADLVNDVVDYGGEIGKQQYRLMLNNTFKGKMKGIGFFPTPPKDPDTKETIKGVPWALHDNSVITKLAKAIGKPDIQQHMDISQLLGGQFLADVEVRKTPSGKTDAEGNEIVYTNINYKGASKPAPVFVTDADGNEVEEIPVFAPLKAEPKCITFENATKEDIGIIRPGIIKVIKLAHNYAGSQMQKAIEEFEAEQGSKQAPVAEQVAPAKAAAPKAAPKQKATPVATPAPTPAPAADMDDDIPF